MSSWLREKCPCRFDFSQPRARGKAEGRADRVGSPRFESRQCRRHGAPRWRQQSVRGAVVCRFSSQSGRSKNLRRKVSLCDLDQELWFQAVVSGKRHDPRAVRKGRRSLEKTVEGLVAPVGLIGNSLINEKFRFSSFYPSALTTVISGLRREIFLLV